MALWWNPKWRPPPSWILFRWNFGHVIRLTVIFRTYIQNLNQIPQSWAKLWLFLQNPRWRQSAIFELYLRHLRPSTLNVVSVLKFNANKLLSFEDIEIFIFLRLCWDCLTTPLFLRVFGKFDPLNVVGRRADPKRHILTWFRIIWAIVRRNRPTGQFSRRVVENKIQIKLKKRPYISRNWPHAPSRPICTKFGLRVCLMDGINCEKFYRNRLRGLDIVGV